MSILTEHPRQHVRLLRLFLHHDLASVVSDAGTEAELRAEDERDGDPVEFASDLEDLGPTFVKLGQILSGRPDLLPDDYIDALSRLQDQVAPFSPADVREIVQDELGHDVDDVYRHFDPNPLAAASLAQVHRAVLLDGREVVVKVQRPGIAATVRRDLETLQQAATALEAVSGAARRMGVVGLVDQFRSALVSELDLRAEADNLLAMATFVEPHDRLACPRPVLELTSRRVLTMDYVDGHKVTEITPLRRTDLDGEELASQLVRSYLDQILVHGFVHADPHPGNMLITPDGRLALLDLGLVARLGSTRRQQLLDLFLAMAEGRSGDFVRVAAEMGTTLPDYDEAKLERLVSDLLGRFATANSARLRAGDVLVHVARAAADVGLRPAPELTLVGKALAQVDQVVDHLAPELDVHAVLEDHAAAILRHHVSERASGLRAARLALQTARFAEELPARANQVLGDLAEGRFRVKVDAIDQEELLRGLEKIATRVTVGIVLAAMLVGAALAMRVDSELRLFGMPAVAGVFFVLAGLCGLGLVLHVVVADRHDRHRRER